VLAMLLVQAAELLVCLDELGFQLVALGHLSDLLAVAVVPVHGGPPDRWHLEDGGWERQGREPVTALPPPPPGPARADRGGGGGERAAGAGRRSLLATRPG